MDTNDNKLYLRRGNKLNVYTSGFFGDNTSYGFYYIEPDKKELNKSKVYDDLIPKRVIFNGKATIVFWNDDTKTVVRCAKGEKFIPEVGVAEAIVKKVFGGTAKGRERFLRLLKKAQYQDESKKE